MTKRERDILLWLAIVLNGAATGSFVYGCRLIRDNGPKPILIASLCLAGFAGIRSARLAQRLWRDNNQNQK